jgi:hypothetical protein
MQDARGKTFFKTEFPAFSMRGFDPPTVKQTNHYHRVFLLSGLIGELEIRFGEIRMK